MIISHTLSLLGKRSAVPTEVRQLNGQNIHHENKTNYLNVTTYRTKAWEIIWTADMAFGR
jgi:hypothetical protein